MHKKNLKIHIKWMNSISDSLNIQILINLNAFFLYKRINLVFIKNSLKIFNSIEHVYAFINYSEHIFFT
jgi:hypothetical protein